MDLYDAVMDLRADLAKLSQVVARHVARPWVHGDLPVDDQEYDDRKWAERTLMEAVLPGSGCSE